MEMHILVVFGLIINACTRIVGTILGLDMYFKTKDQRHLFQIVGWFTLFFSSLCPLATIIVDDLFVINLFLISNLVFLNIGLFLLISSLSSYFKSYPKFILVSIISIIIILPFLTYFLLDYNSTINISVLLQFIILIIFLSVFYLNRKEIKEFLQYSFGLISLLMIFILSYLSVVIYLRLNGYDYGLYNSSDIIAIMLNYGVIAIITILGIIVFLHLEQGIFHKQRNTLKDDYSHKIGNILQIIMVAGEIIKNESPKNEEVQEKASLILKQSNEAGTLINEIRKM